MSLRLFSTDFDISADLDSLTPQQLNAAHSLAAGATEAEAARSAGIHCSTLYNLRRLPAFEAAVIVLRGDYLSQRWAERRRKAADLVDLATRTIETALKDETAPASVRLRAAAVVLDRFWDRSLPAALSGPRDPETLAEHWRQSDEMEDDFFTPKTWCSRPDSEAVLEFKGRIARMLDGPVRDRDSS